METLQSISILCKLLNPLNTDNKIVNNDKSNNIQMAFLLSVFAARSSSYGTVMIGGISFTFGKT